jgi:hypothetical protein
MRTLQDYRDKYREIARSLGYTGDSAELLIQLLSNASYIEEVENIRYMEESSLSTAILENSKIQHCVDMMYSVFRGTCPRVLLHFKPNKKVQFTKYSEIISSSNFKIFYLGFIDDTRISASEVGKITWEDIMKSENTFSVEPSSFGQEYTIVGLLSTGDEHKTTGLQYTNGYYIDVNENNISNDVYVISNGGINRTVTRNFSSHLLNGDLFDLTIPGYGSRLYFYGSGLISSDSIDFHYFPFTELGSFQESELKRITLKDTELTKISGALSGILGNSDLSEIAPGIVYVPEVPKEDLRAIHYNANKGRYTNAIVRSNNDLSYLLVQDYSGKVRSAVCRYNSDGAITVYYIPTSNSNLLSEQEKSDFKTSKQAYFVTTELSIEKATEITGVLDIDLVLKESGDNLEEEIRKIVAEYEYNFEYTPYLMKAETFNSGIKNKILSELSKIDNIRYVKDVVWTPSDSDEGSGDDAALRSYYKISLTINTTIL